MPSEIHASELLRFISEAFVYVDAEFRVREMNEEAVRLEGRPASEIIGKLLWEAWPQYVSGTPMRELWEQVMETREPAALEQQSDRSYRETLWLEVRVLPYRDGMAILYRDISDRKRSEDQLKQAEAELIHASRVGAMGAMAATLAHELSQPLTTIGNYLDAARSMLSELPAGEARKARQALGSANASARRASEILRRLRAFVAKGKVEAQRNDLQVIIADAGILLLPQAQREGVEIAFSLDRYARWVCVDAVQIQQVLVNLVRNAIEAMREVAEKRIMIATALRADGRIEVCVTDTGPGIGIGGDRLFAPFQTSKREGLGMGLSISRTIVEAHGGTIEAEPRDRGTGATFRFTLPRAEPPGIASIGD